MVFDTTRFGELNYEEAEVIFFPEGLPGLEEQKRFIYVSTPETEPIFWLQSLEDRDIALPVAQVFELFEDYAFDIADADIELLKIEKPENVIVLTVIVIPDAIAAMTANLAAPIVIHKENGYAKQIFIPGTSYSVRQSVFDAVLAALERREADAGALTQGE